MEDINVYIMKAVVTRHVISLKVSGTHRSKQSESGLTLRC